MSKIKQAIGIMLFESDEFGGPKIVGGGICPTQRANKTCCGVIEVMETEQKIGNIFGFTGGNYAGNVYDKDHLSPTLNTMQGGCKQPMMIERDVINPLKGISENGWHFEQNVYDANGLVRSLKSESGSGNIPKAIVQYRIRKLTPKECWRLMDFSDEDFEKAAEVNSNTQLYKQAGNSIVANVLVAILGQLLPGKENVYKELSE